MSTLLQLRPIFQEIFDDPTLVVNPDTSQHQIPDWDSVAQVKLVLAIEEAFAIRFTNDELPSMHSVADFMTAIGKLKGVNE